MNILSYHHRLAMDALRVADLSGGFEYRCSLLRIYAEPLESPGGGGTPDIYLEAVEKTPGGLVSLGGRPRLTLSGLREFFTNLALRTGALAAERPYRLGQSYDGAMHAPVLTAFKTACDAFTLNADDVYREAYPRPDEPMPAWEALREEAEWQGGVECPVRWDAGALDALKESLTEINYHSLVSVLARRCAVRL